MRHVDPIGRHVDVDHRFQLRDVEPRAATSVATSTEQLRLRTAPAPDRARAAPARRAARALRNLRAQHVEQVAALLLRVAERERADWPVMIEQEVTAQALVVVDFVALLDLRVRALLGSLISFGFSGTAGQFHDAF